MLNYIIFIIGCIFYLIMQKLATNFCLSYYPNAHISSYIIVFIVAFIFDFLYWMAMMQFHFYSI